MNEDKCDLVAQWKEAARLDDLFDHMVPSDVRQLIGEIERLRAECTQLKAQQKELLTNRKIYEG